MGTTTSNFNLIKPAREDFYSIQDQNSNMDIIDAELKAARDTFKSHNHDGRYETPEGAQAKANAAEVASKNYTDLKEGSIKTELSAHLSDSATISIHSKALKSDLTLYVDTANGSDNTGDGSGTKPFATIQKVLSVTPKNLNGFQATINIKAGNYYLNDYIISGYHGGILAFYGTNKPIINVTTRLDIKCNQYTYFNGLKFQGNGMSGIVYVMEGKAQFNNCEFNALDHAVNIFENGQVNFVIPVMNNNNKCIVANYNSLTGVYRATGSNNILGYASQCGSGIGLTECTLTATTMSSKENGWILDGNVFK